MANTRDANKLLVKDQFVLLGQTLKKAAEAKNAYRENLKAIGKLSNDYTEDYLDRKIAEAASSLAAQNRALYEDAVKQVEKLQGALNELHSQLDLSDPALTNAVGLIKTLGKELDFENIQKINTQFAGDQPALQVLQKAYASAGLHDGFLEDQVYNAEHVATNIGQQLEAAFQKGGSLNMLASTIGKYAKLEGITDFETLPDPAGFDEATRRGAGLPEQAPE